MTFKYQLIILGNFQKLTSEVKKIFLQRVADLGIDLRAIQEIQEDDFNQLYSHKNPSVCLYFGSDSQHDDESIINTLIDDAVFILPIVEDLDKFQDLCPKQLHPINGILLHEATDVEAVVGRALEALGLLRESRRLFISYRRLESRAVAIQLYEYLDSQGFQVFLDTHSIRPGDDFQNELWHKMVDTDVVILLDTVGFLDSKWTELELAKAQSMSISILQLIWPENSQKSYSKLSTPLPLNKADFLNQDFSNKLSELTDDCLKKIGNHVESLRARSLAARQTNLIEEFTDTAKGLNCHVTLSDRILSMITSKGNEIAIIPTIGVPQSLTYHQADDIIIKIKQGKVNSIFLLYDHRSILEKWEKHLAWLDSFLRIKTIKVTETETWIPKLMNL